jgi:hypothetical protein
VPLFFKLVNDWHLRSKPEDYDYVGKVAPHAPIPLAPPRKAHAHIPTAGESS